MKLHEQLTEEMKDWISKQPLFFVASAPLSADGHVNLSPRGYDCLRILDNHTVAWLDLTGSGNETSAHIQENGRITLMFCAFDGEPLILRLYGKGEVLLPDHPDWNRLRPLFPDLPGERQIIRVDIERIQTSCGFSVPLMEKLGDRSRLIEWTEKKGEEGIRAYQATHNSKSIDNLEIKIRQD